VVTAEAPLLDSSLDEVLASLADSLLPADCVPELVADSVLVEAVDAVEEPVLVCVPALAVRLALATRAGS
jgi:hypothetical protein